jgi:hypothetical protein
MHAKPFGLHGDLFADPAQADNKNGLTFDLPHA